MNYITAKILILEHSTDIEEFLTTLKIDPYADSFVRNICLLINLPFSVVFELSYVDRVYRDCYYNYFSSKHFDTDRNAIRVTFFNGIIRSEDFYNEGGHENLNREVIGFTIIRPINPGCIGRTMLDPKKFNIKQNYVRTSAYTFVLLGVKLEVNAFPFSAQDTETMSCAETTAWSILEYFGLRYPEYKIVNPSDILSAISKHAFERVLPSSGLQYTQVAYLFKEFGFAPRLYFSEAYNSKEFKRLFHYYVESGIPLAVAVKAEYNGSRIGHSIVCIGHSAEKNTTVKPEKREGISIINSADFYDEYVLNDDNQIPYVIKEFNNFTLYDKPKVSGFVVPLYKRIFLEAGDASSIALNTLCHKDYGIDPLSLKFSEHVYEDDSNPLVVRIFLTSSRQYKHFKSLNSNNEHISKIVSHLPMPKFIWIAELSLKSLYLEDRVFGEIIIDATASRYTKMDSLVMLHYPGIIGWRSPSDKLTSLFDMLKLRYDELSGTYPLYQNNLR